MRTGRMRRWIAGALAALALTAAGGTCVLAAPGVPASPRPETLPYTQQITYYDTVRAILIHLRDSESVYRQLKNALLYNQITEFDIYSLRLDPTVSIPDAALQKLAAETFISPFLLHTCQGVPYTAADLMYVFDPVWYYQNNPIINTVVPYDANLMLAHFQLCGMAAGLQGSPAFNLACYKTNYPYLVAAFGENNLAYYQYYLMVGQKSGQVADRVVAKK